MADRKGTIEQRAKANFCSVEHQTAIERVEDRGIPRHAYAFEVALRDELGVSAQQSDDCDSATRKAADARLVRGERDLHDARQSAAAGELPKR